MATQQRQIRHIDIRPRVNVLRVLAHLEYKVWYALAEYVDNSIESFRLHKEAIQAIDPEATAVSVWINVDGGNKRITISDNAGGIAWSDFPRAFRPAELPNDRTGLCEFGMGMKSASCWFTDTWRVRTSAIGEPVERIVTFDISRIVADQLEELEVEEIEARPEDHFTVIELENVRTLPVGRSVTKVREHLADIYRGFLRDESLRLFYRGDPLAYEEPAILQAPFFDSNNDPRGEDVTWRKEIEFDFGQGLFVHGFAALRARGSTGYAGFSLFRRGRVVEGSGDEKYRPTRVFGAPNSYVTQRLFGELHLGGFEVSHTKDGFRWDDSEEPFLDLLKEHLDSEEMPLLKQARNYREKAARAVSTKAAREAVDSTAASLTRYGPEVVHDLATKESEEQEIPETLDDSTLAAERQFLIEADGVSWSIMLRLSTDASRRDWLTISEDSDPTEQKLGVELALESSFMKRQVRLDDTEMLEPVVRIAAGLALAEHLARLGRGAPSVVRLNLNRLLEEALSRHD